jgi:hypothetical protein
MFVEHHLAQVNIGKMLGLIDAPVMADFVANLDRINTLAESSAGFVWRLKDEGNNATSFKVYDDALIIMNLSVWETLDDLVAYVYRSDHAAIFRRRQEWFEKMTRPYATLWYVPQGTVPSPQDAVERLDHLEAHGETPYAFSFKKKFTAAEALAFQRSQ